MPGWQRGQFAGIIRGPGRPWDLNRTAFHPDLLDLAERFLGSADLRLYDSELWVKCGGALDHDQNHHRDFVGHSPVVPTRTDRVAHDDRALGPIVTHAWRQH